MKVKICGIQSIGAAKAAESAGADMIGFVFAESRRQVSMDEAGEIAKCLSPDIKKAGVFVNSSKAFIEQAVRTAGLDYVQLHGDEDAEFAEAVDAPVIKAFSAGSKLTFEEMFSYPADFILIDSASKEKRGGTGETFDWSQLNDENIDKERLVLAGGINEDNIEDARRTVGPKMVDLSSGAETNGVKDEEKINRIMKKIKGVKKLGENIPTT